MARAPMAFTGKEMMVILLQSVEAIRTLEILVEAKAEVERGE